MKKILLLLSLFCLSNITQAKNFFDLKIMRLACPSSFSGGRATHVVFEKYLIYNDNMRLEDIEPIIISWCKESPTFCSYMNGKYVSEDDYDDEQEDEDSYDNDPNIDITSLGEEILSILGDRSNTRSLDITNGEEFVKQIQEFQNSKDSTELACLYEIVKELMGKISCYISEMTYLDDFTNKLHAFTHYQSSLTSTQAARCQKVIKTLKKIGVAQTLSNAEIDLFAQLIKNKECLISNDNKIYKFDETYTIKEIKQIERNIMEERIAILEKLLAIYA